MQKDSKILLGVSLIIIIALLGFVIYSVKGSKIAGGPGKLDSFATCLKDSGAVFYGAFWCPHCQAEKALFGSSEKKLPYVECSTPDGNGQTQACKDNKIESYPTWVFSDGSKLVGEVSLDTLSKKTNCPINGYVSTSTVSVASSSSAVK